MDAFLVAGKRTAVGKASRGGFKSVRPDDLAVKVIKHLLDSQPNLDPNLIEDLIVGNAVPEAEQGLQMGRLIALGCLPLHVGGVTVNRYCGSGVETIAMAAGKLATGQGDCFIAGGTESMSKVPTVGFRPLPNPGFGAEHPDWFYGMGLTAEAVAQDYGITREDCDVFSYESHQRALKALQEGYFSDQILPIEVTEKVFTDGQVQENRFTVAQDEGPRPDTSLEALAKLRPVFAKDGMVTAGNSSQTSDGAAFWIVANEQFCREHNLEPIAQMKSYAVAGVEPRVMGIGPIAAIPKALKRANLRVNDLDVTELNEAFATQAVAVIREVGLNPDTTNPNGGAIALGHPLGCTGSILTLKGYHETKRTGGKHFMVTACVGGGQGVAGIFEAL